MRLCVVDTKQCWRDADGRWMSYGGFPAQMGALRALCDEMTIVVLDSFARAGGMPLPHDARVVALRSPAGVDFRRKLSVAGHLPYYLGRIRREVQSADVVYSALPGDLAFLGAIVAAAGRRRLFAIYNGSWEPNSETTMMNRVTRQLMRTLAYAGDVMLAVGDAAVPPARRMEWLFATSLTRAELAGGSPRFERGLSAPPRIIYAGRLSAEKGVPILLRALATLKDAGFRPLPELVLAGGGPELDALRTLAETLGCDHLVRFAGQLDRAALMAEMRAADFCVHASHTEGYCKAWLDAMAQGLPVLGTEVGAAAAVIGREGERGWLVPPGSPEAFAEALMNVLTVDRDWPALRARCRAFAEGRTLEAWAEHIARACARRWNAGFRAGAILSSRAP